MRIQMGNTLGELWLSAYRRVALAQAMGCREETVDHFRNVVEAIGDAERPIMMAKYARAKAGAARRGWDPCQVHEGMGARANCPLCRHVNKGKGGEHAD